MNIIPKTRTASEDKEIQDIFDLLQSELHQGLTLYWNSADEILHKSGVKLNKTSEDYFSLENNFFSAIFLYSYVRGGISKPKRILYAAVNHCLRGMVTGCDNLLDNEYKKTLDTDLPVKAVKFRSILDIMVSDRILVAIMHKGYQEGEFLFEHILQANRASLHALLKSGAQEAGEEEGSGEILKPEQILNRIHSLKTGLLFQAPWVLPQLLETDSLQNTDELKEGLFHIGMGCQIMDDMVDLSMDAQMNRHNYIASLIWHGKNSREKEIFKAYLTENYNVPNDLAFLFQFPEARKTSTQKALDLLRQGTEMLFDKKHNAMIPYSIDFFTQRIGAHRFFE